MNPLLKSILSNKLAMALYGIASPEAQRHRLQNRPEVIAVKEAYNKEIQPEEIQTFCEKLLGDHLKKGEKFPFEEALSALAVALEDFHDNFVQLFLFGLSSLQSAEIPYCTRIARRCLMGNTDQLLTKLQEKLNKGGLNYTVGLQVYKLPFVPGKTTEKYLKEILPEAILGDLPQPLKREELLRDVENGLRHRGERPRAYGPDPDVLEEKEFNQLVLNLLNYLNLYCVQAEEGENTFIESFWLLDGHPFYPVFWDFAFTIAGPKETTILIGSSSD